MIFLDLFTGMCGVSEFNRDNKTCVLSANNRNSPLHCSSFEFSLLYLVGFKGEIWRPGSEYGKHIDSSSGKN